jgi:hypothetical protein
MENHFIDIIAELHIVGTRHCLIINLLTNYPVFTIAVSAPFFVFIPSSIMYRLVNYRIVF